jgi:transaldolase
MKFFLDTANVAEIREAHALGVLDGVTTNPSLVAKERRDYAEVVREICSFVKGPVSAEVIATDYEGMLREGRAHAKIAPNVVVKCPLIPDGIKATKTLSEEGIRVNVTLCFSATQALIAAKAGAAYISPFVGRLDDISMPGMDLVRDIRAIYQNYGFKTEILAASIRHPVHVLEAALAGADVATMPHKILMQCFEHPLTDIGLKKFLADWEKAKKK